MKVNPIHPSLRAVKKKKSLVLNLDQVIFGFLPVYGLFSYSLSYADPQRVTPVSLHHEVSEIGSKPVESLTPEQSAKKLNELGVDLVLKSKTEDGIQAFKKGIETDSTNPTLRYNLAGVYLSLGDIDSAKAQALKCVELKPNELSFLHRLGEIQFAAKNFTEAAKSFEKIATLNPEFNEVIFHLGTVYAMQQKWPEAEGALRRARDIYPSNSSIDTNLANVLIMTKKFSEASKILEKVSIKEPSAEVNLALGIAYEAAGDEDKALLAYQVAKSLGSKDSHLDARIEAANKKIAGSTGAK